MKRIKNRCHTESMNVASVLSSIALMFSFIAANSRCYFIFHQPKMPPEMRRLKDITDGKVVD